MELINGHYFDQTYYVLEDNGQYKVMTRIQVDDIVLTWFLCVCKTFNEAIALAKSFNDIWKDQYYKMLAEEKLDSLLGRKT